MGGYLLFGQHQYIIQRMWRDVFETCMTTNSCLSELWTENVEETKVNVFVTRHRQIEMALQYFDQKCQPLRQLIENVTFFGGCDGDEGSVSSDNKLQKWDGRFSSGDENRKQSLHLDYVHLDLSSTCINGNNNLKIDCSDEKIMPPKKTAFSTTAEPNPTTMIITDPQEEKPISNTTSSVTNPLTENEIYDRNTDRCLLQQTQNIDNVTNHNLLQTDNEQDVKSSSSIIAFGDNYQVLQKNNVRSAAKHQLSTICLNNTANKSRNDDSANRLRKDVSEQEDTLLKISLENLRVYLCEKPSSSFDAIFSCSNNFEKLKYLRTKEKESPSVRISCAFQQGYYLETLFPGRRIRNQSGNVCKNYAEHLQELNMSHSYSRQLRQFYKSFRYYRRFLHLYVPLRTILRNITRIRDKIDLSEDEQLFWSLMPINGLRIFYECYSYWFGLDLCDVYTIFDVIDNYPSGTVDQFLQSNCIQLFQCEGFVKALNWLQNIADRNKYLLVYKTLKRAHCVVVEKDEAGWSYEKSFDLDKDNIIFAGFYIFIKHH